MAARNLWSRVRSLPWGWSADPARSAEEPLEGRPSPSEPGPERVARLSLRRRSARPGPAERLAGADPGPFRSTRPAAGGAGFLDVLRHRRRAAWPGLGGLQAGGWRCPDQLLWAGPGSWVLAGRRPPQRQGRTALPRARARRGRCRRGRARRRAGREGWRLRGRSGARATSRSRRRCRAGDHRREARFPPRCVQGPVMRVRAAANWTRRRPAPAPRTWPVEWVPALGRRVERPARQRLTAPRLGFASPDPRRRDPPPRPTPIPDPRGQGDPAPWSPAAARPPSPAPEHRPPGPRPGPARRWPRRPGSGRW